MIRFLRYALAVTCFCAVTGFGQNLDAVCMTTSADSVLTVIKAQPDSVIPDSLDTLINTMTVAGTCDSAVILLPVKFGMFTTNVVVMTFKKVNSCSLSVAVSPLLVAYYPAATDTVINVCASGVRYFGVAGNARTGKSGISVRLTGRQLKVAGLRLDLADRLVVRVIDEQGREVRTYRAAGVSAPIWRTDLRHGPFIAVLNLNGKTVAAGRIDWMH